MHGAERAELLARVSKFADDGAIQLHFVNLARHRGHVGDVIVGIGIGAVQILMRARGNANRPGSANLVVDRLELEIVVEDLDSPVASVPNIDIALGVGGDRVRQIELALPRSFGTHRRDVSPFLSYLTTL